MKSTSKKTLDTKAASKSKEQRPTKKAAAPVVERDQSFSDTHQDRTHRPMTDHEPGTI